MGSNTSFSALKFCEEYEGFILVALYFPDMGYWSGYLGRRDGTLIEVGREFDLNMQASEIPELNSEVQLHGFSTIRAGDFNVDPEGRPAYANRSIFTLHFPRFWGKQQVMGHLKDAVVKILQGANLP